MPWYEPVRRSVPHFQFPNRECNNTNNGDEEHEWRDENDAQTNTTGNAENNSNFGYQQEEEEFDVGNYLSGWRYHDRGHGDTHHDNGVQENHVSQPLDFNGFQHQVEHRLGNVFPNAEFAFLSSSRRDRRSADYPLYNNSMHRQAHSNQNGGDGGDSIEGNYNGNQHGNRNYLGSSNNNINTIDINDTESSTKTTNNATISKAAQFFHPRPVMALQQYKGFFSPLNFPTCDDSNDENNDDTKMAGIGKEHGHMNMGRNDNGNSQDNFNKNNKNRKRKISNKNISHGETYQSVQQHQNNYSQAHHLQQPSQLSQLPPPPPHQHNQHNHRSHQSQNQHHLQEFSQQQNHSQQHHNSHQFLQQNYHHHSYDDINRTRRISNEGFHGGSNHDHQRQQSPINHAQQQQQESEKKSSIANDDKNDDDTASHHRPRKLFDPTLPNKTSKQSSITTNPFKQAPVQSKITQDKKTGQLSSKAPIFDEFAALPVAMSSKSKIKTWDDYGGRAVGNGANTGTEDKEEKEEKMGRSKKKTKSSKDKKEKKAKKKKSTSAVANSGGKGRENGIDVLLNNIATRDKQQKEQHPCSNNQETNSGDAIAMKSGKRKSSSSSSQSNVTSAQIGKKSKKQKRSKQSFATTTFSELDVPPSSYLDDSASAQHTTETDTFPTITEQDFDGIEEMKMQNAGACIEGLNAFLVHVMSQTHVAWTMLFLDPYTGNYTFSATNGCGEAGVRAGAKSRKYQLANQNHGGYECTTPFLPSSKKYCTEKGPMCNAWNCICENQIRAKRGKAMLLGAMFVFRDSADNENGELHPNNDISTQQQEETNTFCYLLPLGPTATRAASLTSSSPPPDQEYSRMSNWPILPFECGVSVEDRWNALKGILYSNGATKLVTYNAQVQLLPLYYHQMHDGMSVGLHGPSQTQSDDLCFSVVPSHTSRVNLTDATQSQGLSPTTKHNNIIYSIWDLRVVSWMLRADASDAELEFDTFRKGFAHLIPQQQSHSKQGMPILSQGLIEARKNLDFLHLLYPIIDQQLIDKDLHRALYNIEAPVQSILAAMECRGIAFFPHRLGKIESQLNARVHELEIQSQSITKHSGFLLSSPQQVSNYLFDVLKLTVPQGLVAKTKAGSIHRSTSEEAIKAIKSEMISRTGDFPPIIDIILEFRSLNKLLTTYIRGLPKLCCREEQFSGRRSKKALTRM